MLANQRIFITGGAGFIGSSLIARLVQDNQIVVFDNFHRDSISHTKLGSHANVSIIKGDVLDFESVAKAMAGATTVVHAAAIAGIDTVLRQPTRTMRVAMLGTANVLEAARLNNINRRVVAFSTSEVFGSMAFKPTEDADTVTGSAGEARWTYAVGKLASEHLAMAYHREFALPVVAVRPFNVYGPGQTGEGAIQVFIKRALKDEDLTIHGDGNQIRAWCYIDDFLDCLVECIENPKAVGEAFNIGNARAVMTTYGLAETVCRVLGSNSRVVFAPALSAEIELRIPSVEKSLQLLGFKAKVDLEDGIRRTAEWLRTYEARPSHG